MKEKSRRMSRNLCLAALVMAVLAPAAREASSQTPVREDHGMVRVGESLFRAYCTSCHGRSGAGDGPIASTLKVEPADLTLISRNNRGTFPFEDVHKKIDGREKVRGHGSSDMPVWGKVFTEAEDGGSEETVSSKVTSLAHYLWSIQADQEDR